MQSCREVHQRNNTTTRYIVKITYPQLGLINRRWYWFQDFPIYLVPYALVFCSCRTFATVFENLTFDKFENKNKAKNTSNTTH